jgi:hypothetical protein
LSGGTQKRSWEYENGEDEQKAENNWGVFWRRPGPQKGLWHNRWLDGQCQKYMSLLQYITWQLCWSSGHVATCWKALEWPGFKFCPVVNYVFAPLKLSFLLSRILLLNCGII